MFGQKYQSSESSGDTSNEVWIKRFPKGASQMKVRVLSDDLNDQTYAVRYTEVYDKSVSRGWPLHTNEPTDDYENEPSQNVARKILISVLNVEDERIWAWAAPWTFIEHIEGLLKVKGTVTDVDLIVVREGTGLDTHYTVFEGDRYEVDLSKYDLPDLERVLTTARRNAEEEGYVEPFAGAQEAPEPVSKPAPKKAPPVKNAAEPEPEEEPEPEAETLGDLPEGWEDHSIGKQREYARSLGVDPKGKTRAEIIAAIAEHAEPF